MEVHPAVARDLLGEGGAKPAARRRRRRHGATSSSGVRIVRRSSHRSLRRRRRPYCGNLTRRCARCLRPPRAPAPRARAARDRLRLRHRRRGAEPDRGRGRVRRGAVLDGASLRARFRQVTRGRPDARRRRPTSARSRRVRPAARVAARRAGRVFLVFTAGARAPGLLAGSRSASGSRCSSRAAGSSAGRTPTRSRSAASPASGRCTSRAHVGKNPAPRDAKRRMTISHLHSVAPAAEPIDLARGEGAAGDLLLALGGDLEDESLRDTPRRMAEALRRAPDPAPVQRHDVPQRRGLRRARRRRATSRSTRSASTTCCPFHGRRARRLPARRADHRAVEARPRVVELFARDLQVQERLTTQVADWLERAARARAASASCSRPSTSACRCAACRSPAPDRHLCPARPGARRSADPPGVPGPRDGGGSRHEQHATDVRDRRRQPGRRQGRRGPARGGLRRRASCSSATRPTRPTSARRSRRTTCAARPSATRLRAHDEGFYDEHDDRAAHRHVARPIDAGASEVVLDGGERIGFDRLLLATGAEPRGACRLAGRRPRRRPRPAHARATATRCASVLARGGRARRHRRGLDRLPRSPRPRGRGAWRWRSSSRAGVPLERVLGAGGRRDLPRRPRATTASSWSLGAGIEAIEGVGRVEGVRTGRRARRSTCDLVVVGVGVAPRTRARRGGRARRSTTASSSTSASRTERARHLRRRRRRQRRPPVLRPSASASSTGPTRSNQGPAAARNMLGTRRRLRPPPVLLLRPVRRRHGVRRPARRPDDRVVFRGDPATREFIAFWLRDGRVVAGMNVNVWDVSDPIQALSLARDRRPRPAGRPRGPARRGGAGRRELAPRPARGHSRRRAVGELVLARSTSRRGRSTSRTCGRLPAGEARRAAPASRVVARRASRASRGAGSAASTAWSRNAASGVVVAARRRAGRSGLRCRPSCAQVRISNSSSSVPMPPGSATNASARSAISALRSCIEPTTRRSVSPAWRDLAVDQRLRDDADHLAAGRERARRRATPISPTLPPP